MPELTLVDGFVINYEEWGDPEAPAVVLLHGFTADLRSWAQHAPAFAEDYRVIAPDLRGHGRTTAPEDLDAYTMAAFAGDVKALVDALGFGLFALVGSSFGGMVSAHFATEWPERIAALVLSDTSAAYQDSRYEEPYFERERGIDRMEETVRKAGTAGLGKQLAAGIADEFLRQATIRRYASLSPEGFIGTAKVRRERPNLLPVLQSRLAMPVLVVAGETDPVRSASEVIAAELPGARYVQFREAGHTVPMHRPGDFADAVIGFLRDVEDGIEIAGRHLV
ncbi:MAG: alpha/beta fold hydrolase [Dehalococcoidia bacterium]|nr:alpha/beta fold hydrolase [Dehalococcoidia bacterium]